MKARAFLAHRTLFRQEYIIERKKQDARKDAVQTATGAFIAAAARTGLASRIYPYFMPAHVAAASISDNINI